MDVTEGAARRVARRLNKDLGIADWRRDRAIAGSEAVDGAMPRLVCIGAQRAGTTFLWDLLIGERAGRVKELHAFDRTRLDDSLAPTPDFIRRYCAHVASMGGLDFTPAYATSPIALETIATRLPGVPVVMILRDPRARLLSALAYHRQRYGSVRAHHVAEALDKSDYPRTLRMLDLLGLRNRTTFLQFEQFVDDPSRALAKLWGALGIPLAPAGAATPRRNSSAAGKSGAPQSAELPAGIEKLLERARRETLESVEDLDPSRWPGAVDSAQRTVAD